AGQASRRNRRDRRRRYAGGPDCGEVWVMRCAVIGGGAWGTALADLLAGNGNDVVMWALEPDVADSINRCHENERFLRGFRLEPSLQATNDPSEALRGASLIVYATPSEHLRRVISGSAAQVEQNAILVVPTKGIERGSLALMTEVAKEEVKDHSVVGIAGPSFASEVVAKQPTAIVAASTNSRAAQAVQNTLSSG